MLGLGSADEELANGTNLMTQCHVMPGHPRHVRLDPTRPVVRIACRRRLAHAHQSAALAGLTRRSCT